MPVVCPVHPGRFVLVAPPVSPAPATTKTSTAAVSVATPLSLTAADITTQKIVYDECLRLYNEYKAVEQGLWDIIT